MLPESLHQFIHFPSEKGVFILTGQAGTGKTTLVAEIVAALNTNQIPFKLAAPTGRAAKVLSDKTGHKASTLHRLIYLVEEQTDKGGHTIGFSFKRKDRSFPEPTVIVVDEASMLSDAHKQDGFFQQASLLEDLLLYTFHHFPDNKLLLVGDAFQLPPVGAEVAPALTTAYFEQKGYQVNTLELTQVYRQAKGSTILENATRIRTTIEALSTFDSPTSFEPEIDYHQVNLIKGLEHALPQYLEDFRNQPDQTIFITYANANAAKLNKRIRAQLFEKTDLPHPDEPLMVVKNHYFKPQKTDALHFIANGETVNLLRLPEDTIEQYAGLKWAEAYLKYESADGKPRFYNHKMVIDLLQSADTSLTAEQMRTLFMLRKRTKNFQITDPYTNALQIKYAYAITAHKAQGGEWKRVYLYLDRMPSTLQIGYLKWLYTAFTRAAETLTLVLPA